MKFDGHITEAMALGSVEDGLGLWKADWNPGSGLLSRASRKRAWRYCELQISHHFEELGRIQRDKCEVSDLYLP